MRLLLLNARPLSAAGLPERTLAWLGERLSEEDATLDFLTTDEHDAIADALHSDELEAVIVGSLRPGPDLPVVGALARWRGPTVVLDHGYGFCHVGTRTCDDCPLRPDCPSSDRVALYRELAGRAALLVYLSPLHRAASEAYLGAHPDKTLLAPPPALPEVAGAPRSHDMVAFPNPNDPVEHDELAAHAWHRSAAPRGDLVLFGGADAGDQQTAPRLRHAPAPAHAGERETVLTAAAGMASLPSRPLPFGADALAAIHAGRHVTTNLRVGFRSWDDELTAPNTFERVVSGAWDEVLSRLRASIATLPSGRQPRSRNRSEPGWRRPLLWSHRLGMGDAVNLLPVARALGRDAELTWVVPGNHLPLLEGQCDATLVADERFDIERARGQHDLIFEVSVALRQPGERFYEGDVLGERWLRVDLARQPNAYESVTDNLLSLLARGGAPALGGRPRLAADRFPLSGARSRLREAGIDPDRDLVVTLHPGSGRAHKNWPAERYGALARRLRNVLGARVVVIGGLGEEELAAALVAAAGGVAMTAVGDPLPEVAALLALSTLHVGNDSGFTHAAAALGTPTLGLYGPTPPARWAPRGPHTATVRARDAAGSPTKKMDAIRVDEVARQACALLLTVADGPQPPPWSERPEVVNQLVRGAPAPIAARCEVETRATPRCGYVLENGFQHVFPALAMSEVLPGPFFVTGRRVASRLTGRGEVVEVEARRLGEALDAHDIDIAISTSQRFHPKRLRGERNRRVVFVGHGESDKTHGQGASPKPSFVHHSVNDAFDLLAVASHFHMARYANPNRFLAGYLKHDLFVRGGYGDRCPQPDQVLWAPGWGRHSSVRAWLPQVVAATAELGLRCLIHLHPHSWEAEPRVVQEVQVEVLRHGHVRLGQAANLLDAMAPCAALLTDVTSASYDWLMFDRPTVFLDHSGLSVEQEKRLFAVGEHVRPGDELEGALVRALAAPEAASALRREALAAHYALLDGRAAERIRDEIVRRWREEWRHRA